MKKRVKYIGRGTGSEWLDSQYRDLGVNPYNYICYDISWNDEPPQVVHQCQEPICGEWINTIYAVNRLRSSLEMKDTWSYMSTHLRVQPLIDSRASW